MSRNFVKFPLPSIENRGWEKGPGVFIFFWEKLWILLFLPIDLRRIRSMLLLSDKRQWIFPTFFSTGLGWCISIPDHTQYSYDHAQDDVKVDTLLPEKDEPQNQDKNCLHMTEYLEGDGCESANADELAKVCSNGNCARNGYEDHRW